MLSSRNSQKQQGRRLFLFITLALTFDLFSTAELGVAAKDELAFAKAPTPQATLPQTSEPETTAPEIKKIDDITPLPDSSTQDHLSNLCLESLKVFPGRSEEAKLKQSCAEAKRLDVCKSVEGVDIFHIDRHGEPLPGKPNQKILVFSLIHGDETASGSVARVWIQRLAEFQPRNDWRVIPILNPDGLKKKTRTNSRGVDVNRNFPTDDWDHLALKYWKDLSKSNARRFPGTKSASEPETLCALAHIRDFNPDFIISIHTPLGVLDFDGPTKIPFPEFKPLPWRSLGNFPGSLGRYMWKEHGVPVLTVELKGDEVARRQLEAFDKLQDITGTVAIQAQKVMDKMGVEKKPVPEKLDQDKFKVDSTEKNNKSSVEDLSNETSKIK